MKSIPLNKYGLYPREQILVDNGYLIAWISHELDDSDSGRALRKWKSKQIDGVYINSSEAMKLWRYDVQQAHTNFIEDINRRMLSKQGVDQAEYLLSKAELRTDILDRLPQLNDIQQVIVYMVLEGHKQQDIADRFGYSQQYVAQQLRDMGDSTMVSDDNYNVYSCMTALHYGNEGCGIAIAHNDSQNANMADQTHEPG